MVSFLTFAWRAGAVLIVLLSFLVMLAPRSALHIWRLSGSVLTIALRRPDGSGQEALYDAFHVVESIFLPDVKITCMNYGWSHDELQTSQLPFEMVGDELFCLQMYDAVVRAAVQLSFNSSVQAAIGSSAGGVLDGLEVAEVGSGRGGGAKFLWAHHRPRRLVAMDASPKQLTEARRNHLGGIEFVNASFAGRLPLADSSVDLLFSIEAMHTAPGGHLSHFYDEAVRVLRSGGTFAFADFADVRGRARRSDPMFPSFGGLVPVVFSDITDGMLRASKRNAFWKQIYHRLRPWALYLPRRSTILEKIENLLVIPGGARHRAFEERKRHYVLEVYRKL